MYMSFTYVAALLQARLALGTGSIGVLIAFFGIGGIAFVLVARHLVRWSREGSRARLGGGLLGVGFMLLMSVSFVLISGFALFILGLGFFMLHNTLQVRATHMARDATGTALSLFSATFFLAQALGAGFGGWSFDHVGASVSCGSSAAILAGLGFAMGWIADKQESAAERSRDHRWSRHIEP
jgi:predicted MFS family arabinose efflux permease